ALAFATLGALTMDVTAQTRPGMTLDVCPDSFADLPKEGPALTCGCTAEAVKEGGVFGANPYMWQSGICRGVVNAGPDGAQGGQVVTSPAQAAFYPAVTRNRISSRTPGSDRGFQIVVTRAPAATASATAARSAGMTLDVLS